MRSIAAGRFHSDHGLILISLPTCTIKPCVAVFQFSKRCDVLNDTAVLRKDYISIQKLDYATNLSQEMLQPYNSVVKFMNKKQKNRTFSKLGGNQDTE